MALFGVLGFCYDRVSRAQALRGASARSSYFYDTHPDVAAFEAEMDIWYA